MSQRSMRIQPPTAAELDEMHATYRKGGLSRRMAPHIVYSDATCPHAGCDQHLQGIDFRLEAHGKAVHDALLRAWWDDTGFAGKCPRCQGWIHFTIRDKRAITAEEAASLPQLPEDWHAVATII